MTLILKYNNKMNNNFDCIEKLQIKLSHLAAQYRASEENSEQEQQILNEYYKTFEQLVTLNGGIIGLDPDAELPDSLMPKNYVDFWPNGK